MDRFLRYLQTLVTVALVAGCRGSGPATSVNPSGLPLPLPAMLGQRVGIYPLTLLTGDATLGWGESLRPRRAALDRADSVIVAALTERSPEIQWIKPDALRRAARRAPGMLTDPDRMATAILRSPSLNKLPDPLFSQMRNLSGVAGGRLALVPASLVFTPDEQGVGKAVLTLVLVDIRMGLVRWRNQAEGTGDEPWSALWAALKTLAPGLP